MEGLNAVVVVFLRPPGGVYAAGEEWSVVGILAKVVAEVVLPWLKLLEGEAM